MGRRRFASIVKTHLMHECAHYDNTELISLYVSTAAACPSSLLSSAANYVDLVSGVSQNSCAV